MSNDKIYIRVNRGDLLRSQQALANLGRVNLPVQKDGYWLAKTLGIVNKSLVHALNDAQKESNRLINEYGVEIEDKEGKKTGQRGIQQTDTESMQKYQEAMDAFNEKLIDIASARQIPLSTLEAAGIALPLADQAALQWLLKEDNV